MPDDLSDEALLWGESPDRIMEGLRGYLAIDRERTLLRVGHLLQARAARLAELLRYRAAFLFDVDDEIAGVQRDIDVANRLFEEEALRQREAGGPKSLGVPSIGTWNSRTVAGGWTLPEDEALIAGMEEADKPLFVRKVEAEKVEREAFRAHLEAMVDTQIAEEAGTAATDAELAAAEQRARDGIAERYGIQWRAPRISVKGPYSK